jgi:hypothetical protein
MQIVPLGVFPTPASSTTTVPSAAPRWRSIPSAPRDRMPILDEYALLLSAFAENLGEKTR